METLLFKQFYWRFFNVYISIYLVLSFKRRLSTIMQIEHEIFNSVQIKPSSIAVNVNKTVQDIEVKHQFS